MRDQRDARCRLQDWKFVGTNVMDGLSYFYINVVSDDFHCGKNSDAQGL